MILAGDPKASVIIGSCVGGAVSISDYYEHGKKASDVTKMPISSIAPQVAGQCHAGGVVTNIANACAAGTISIAYACELIRASKADVVFAVVQTHLQQYHMPDSYHFMHLTQMAAHHSTDVQELHLVKVQVS